MTFSVQSVDEGMGEIIEESTVINGVGVEKGDQICVRFGEGVRIVKFSHTSNKHEGLIFYKDLHGEVSVLESSFIALLEKPKVVAKRRIMIIAAACAALVSAVSSISIVADSRQRNARADTPADFDGNRSLFGLEIPRLELPEGPSDEEIKKLNNEPGPIKDSEPTGKLPRFKILPRNSDGFPIVPS